MRWYNYCVARSAARSAARRSTGRRQRSPVAAREDSSSFSSIVRCVHRCAALPLPHYSFCCRFNFPALFVRLPALWTLIGHSSGANDALFFTQGWRAVIFSTPLCASTALFGGLHFGMWSAIFTLVRALVMMTRRSPASIRFLSSVYHRDEQNRHQYTVSF